MSQTYSKLHADLKKTESYMHWSKKDKKLTTLFKRTTSLNQLNNQNSKLHASNTNGIELSEAQVLELLMKTRV